MWSSLASKVMVNQFPARQYDIVNIQYNQRRGQKNHEYSDLMSEYLGPILLSCKRSFYFSFYTVELLELQNWSCRVERTPAS